MVDVKEAPLGLLRMALAVCRDTIPILFGYCGPLLDELERRARVERRLEKWLREDGELRTRTQSNVSARLKDYRADREWFAVRGGELQHADDWTLLDAALDKAGAPKESE